MNEQLSKLNYRSRHHKLKVKTPKESIGAVNPKMAVFMYGVQNTIMSLLNVKKSMMLYPEDFKSSLTISANYKNLHTGNLPKKFKFKNILPNLFWQMRNKFDITDEDFLESVKFEPIPISCDNMNAYISGNKLAIFKVIDSESANGLINFMPAYHQYMNERQFNSLLPKYLGIFKISVDGKKTYVIAMKNILNPFYNIKKSQKLIYLNNVKEATTSANTTGVANYVLNSSTTAAVSTVISAGAPQTKKTIGSTNTDNPSFATVKNENIGKILTPGTPVSFPDEKELSEISEDNPKNRYEFDSVKIRIKSEKRAALVERAMHDFRFLNEFNINGFSLLVVSGTLESTSTAQYRFDKITAVASNEISESGHTGLDRESAHASPLNSPRLNVAFQPSNFSKNTNQYQALSSIHPENGIDSPGSITFPNRNIQKNVSRISKKTSTPQFVNVKNKKQDESILRDSTNEDYKLPANLILSVEKKDGSATVSGSKMKKKALHGIKSSKRHARGGSNAQETDAAFSMETAASTGGDIRPVTKNAKNSKNEINNVNTINTSDRLYYVNGVEKILQKLSSIDISPSDKPSPTKSATLEVLANVNSEVENDPSNRPKLDSMKSGNKPDITTDYFISDTNQVDSPMHKDQITQNEPERHLTPVYSKKESLKKMRSAECNMCKPLEQADDFSIEQGSASISNKANKADTGMPMRSTSVYSRNSKMKRWSGYELPLNASTNTLADVTTMMVAQSLKKYSTTETNDPKNIYQPNKSNQEKFSSYGASNNTETYPESHQISFSITKTSTNDGQGNNSNLRGLVKEHYFLGLLDLSMFSQNAKKIIGKQNKIKQINKTMDTDPTKSSKSNSKGIDVDRALEFFNQIFI